MSQSVRNTFVHDYLVPENLVKPVRMPFEVGGITPILNKSDSDKTIKILFIGGDWVRKGGDKLLEWARNNIPKNAILTLITNENLENLPAQVQCLKNVRTGDEKHKEALQSHDILVLPTIRDGLPLVLGEASAYGLAIVTTKMASGAPEVVENGLNGYICDSQEEVFLKLEDLCKSPELVIKMKQNSFQIFTEKYDEEVVFKQYASVLFNNLT